MAFYLKHNASTFREKSISYCPRPNDKENISFANGISFKNLERMKKIRQNYSQYSYYGEANETKEPTSFTNISQIYKRPIQTQRGGVSSIRNKSSKIKSEYDYTTIIQSKDRQIASLHSQVKVLEATVQLLKDQIENSAKYTKKTHQHSSIQSKLSQDKDEEINQLKNYNHKLKKELYEYDNILPKLNELDEVQDYLVDQNQKLRNREEVMKSVLKNIKSLIGGIGGDVSAQVCELIAVILH